MASKILVGALVLGLAFAAAAFASGQKEPAAGGSANTAPGQPVPAGAVEKLVVTGSVFYQNAMHPILKSGNKVYELMVPRFLIYQASVKEGAQVTVEGYQVQGTPWGWQDKNDNVDLFVTKATIDGKDYDLTQFRGPVAGGRGFGYGRMMGGRGPGFGGRGPGYGGMIGGRGPGNGGRGPGDGGGEGWGCRF